MQGKFSAKKIKMFTFYGLELNLFIFFGFLFRSKRIKVQMLMVVSKIKAAGFYGNKMNCLQRRIGRWGFCRIMLLMHRLRQQLELLWKLRVVSRRLGPRFLLRRAIAKWIGLGLLKLILILQVLLESSSTQCPYTSILDGNDLV